MAYAEDMMKSTTLNIRIEPDIKEQAEAVFRQLGLSSTTAVNLFFRQVIMQGGIPFPLMTGHPRLSGKHHGLPSAQTAGQHDGPQQIAAVSSLPAGEMPATLRQIGKPHSRETLQMAEGSPSPPASDASSARHIIPAFTTFDDDASRAEAWQKQHDNEGI